MNFEIHGIKFLWYSEMAESVQNVQNQRNNKYNHDKTIL